MGKEGVWRNSCLIEIFFGGKRMRRGGGGEAGMAGGKLWVRVGKG